MAVSLIRLINDVSWWWTEQKQKIFKKLKTVFVSESILTLFNFNHETILKADLSEYITENIFFQFNNKNVLKLYIYFLKKNSLAECNYKIYNKELLIVIYYLQEWNAELYSVKKFIVIINYKNLKYFTQFQKLSEWHIK